jgi:hypothetical protein
MLNIRKVQEEALLNAVKAQSEEEIAREIVHGDKSQPESDSDWVKSSMERLEHTFPPDVVKQIRMSCQCGYGMDEKLELVQNLYSTAQNLEDFANCEASREAGLFSKDEVLYLQFPFCPCPMLASVDRLPTRTWCHCTTGYSKVLFEKVFGCEVEVELLESIKAGDAVCLMKILPQAPLRWRTANH